MRAVTPAAVKGLYTKLLDVGIRMRRPACPKWALSMWRSLGQWALSMWRSLGQDRAYAERTLILAPGERIVVSTRYHWLWLFREYGSWTNISRAAVTLIVMFMVDRILHWVSAGIWWMTYILWALFLIHGVMVLYRFALWRANLFIMTTAKPIMLHGVLHRGAKPCTIPDSADVRVTQTLIGRVMRYGDLRLDHTLFNVDPDVQDMFTFLPNPRRIHQAIVMQQAYHLSVDPVSGTKRATPKRGPRPPPIGYGRQGVEAVP